MRHALSLLIVTVMAVPAVDAQTQPPRWDDLPRLAADWPPAWGALVRDIAPTEPGFERAVLDRIAKQMQAEKPSAQTFRIADIVLTATLRRHRSLSQSPPLAQDPGQVLEAEIVERLTKLRVAWLQHLQTSGDTSEALALAQRWLPTTPRRHPVRTAILHLWVEQAKAALQKNDLASARSWLDRMEATFTTAKSAAAVRKALHDKAAALFKESASLPDAAAIRALQGALKLWPRLPDARDALARRTKTYQTLRVAVRTLPEQLSPATAWTFVEKQTLDLLFDRLCEVEHPIVLGKRYQPRLANALPRHGAITLRRDAYWSSGERVTAADLRHTALLMNQPAGAGRSGVWREFLELPRLEGDPFAVHIGTRQGLFDPLALLTFFVLPQYYRGKQLDRADGPAFAIAPVGSGPFRYVGRKQQSAVFQANAYDLRRDLGSLREIRFTKWIDPRKDLTKPLPHLALDVPTDQLAAFKALGYTEVSANGSPCVHFLAVNQRQASLASPLVRRALAQAINRQALLDKHFRSPDQKGKHHATANGLFPRASWATCPAPRVPEELYQPDQARSLARKLKPGSNGYVWTLKYADDDPRVAAACNDIATEIRAVFQAAKVPIEVRAVGLPPHAVQKALHERDYDLLYHSVADLDDPVRLALLFDPSADAVKPGGSNYLGDNGDAKLQQLIRASLQHRQFTALQENMQAVHVHLYETMPAIPLWQLDVHVMAHSSLRVPPLEARSIFANIHEWKQAPP